MHLKNPIQFQFQEKILFFAVLGLHLAFAFSIHLSPDEAHYALYASHLDWSYYDHPPMVGWIQWPFYKVSDTDVVLRLVPMACWALSTYMSLVLYQKFKSWREQNNSIYSTQPSESKERIAGVLILWCASPLLNLLSIALVPDCLLMPLVSAMMLWTWEMVKRPNTPSTKLWLGLGVLLGFCGLSKYTAVLLAFSTAFVLLRVHGFKLFRGKGLWIACLIATLMITPVLYWNYEHEWISFLYQFGHASGSQTWQFRKSLIYALVLFLAFGPLLVISFSFDRRSGKVKDQSEPWVHQIGGEEVIQNKNSPVMSDSYFSWVYAAPTLMLLIALAGRGSALPHWIAPAWVALIPLASFGIERWREKKRRLWSVVLSFQVLCCLALGGLILSAGVGKELDRAAVSLPGEKIATSKPNPFADLIGWDLAAKKGIELAAQNHVQTLAVMNWTLASRIAWYARPMPVKVIQSHHDQFDLWFGPMQPGDEVVWIDWSLMTFDPPVGVHQFESCDLLEQMPVTHMGRQIAHFNFLKCKKWQ